MTVWSKIQGYSITSVLFLCLTYIFLMFRVKPKPRFYSICINLRIYISYVSIKRYRFAVYVAPIRNSLSINGIDVIDISFKNRLPIFLDTPFPSIQRTLMNKISQQLARLTVSLVLSESSHVILSCPGVMLKWWSFRTKRDWYSWINLMIDATKKQMYDIWYQDSSHLYNVPRRSSFTYMFNFNPSMDKKSHAR